MRITSPDVEYQLHTRRTRALNYFRAITVELLSINMRVRVYKHFLSHKKAQKHKIESVPFVVRFVLFVITSGERRWGRLR
jgi:hypothetical protein